MESAYSMRFGLFVVLLALVLVPPPAQSAGASADITGFAWEAQGNVDLQLHTGAIVMDWRLPAGPATASLRGDFQISVYEVLVATIANAEGNPVGRAPTQERLVDEWKGPEARVSHLGSRHAFRILPDDPRSGFAIPLDSPLVGMRLEPVMPILRVDDPRGLWHPTFAREAWPEVDFMKLEGTLPTSFSGAATIYAYDVVLSFPDGREEQLGLLHDSAGLQVHRFAVLKFADLLVENSDEWIWLVNGLEGVVAGRVTWYGADGDVVIDGQTTKGQRSLLEMEGEMSVVMTPSPTKARWAMTGDVNQIIVNGHTFVDEVWPIAVAAATIFGGTALALGILRFFTNSPLSLVLGRNLLSSLRPLSHPTRQKILEFVKLHNTSSMAQIQNHAVVSRATARFHTDVLVRAGLLNRQRIHGRDWYCMPATNQAESPLAQIHSAILATPKRRCLLSVLESSSRPLTLTEIVETWSGDRRPSTQLVSYHLGVLLEAGLIERTSQNKRIAWKATLQPETISRALLIAESASSEAEMAFST